MTTRPALDQCELIPTSVRGVSLHRLPRVDDPRGCLTFGEVSRHIPFRVLRYFLVFAVPGEHIRGGHAHRTLEQFLICVNGSCVVKADDGRNSEEFSLSDPSIGLYLPSMVWGVQHRYSRDAVLLVLASEYFDPADYIRDYQEFLLFCDSPRFR